MAKAKKPDRLKQLAIRYFRIQASIKRNYQRSDKLFDEIRREFESVPEKFIPLNEFEKAEMVDNFATDNKVYRAHGISRFELKKVKA